MPAIAAGAGGLVLHPLMGAALLICTLLGLASLAMFRARYKRSDEVFDDAEEFEAKKRAQQKVDAPQLPAMVYGGEAVQPGSQSTSSVRKLQFWKRQKTVVTADPDSKSISSNEDKKDEKAPDYLGKINFRVGYDKLQDAYKVHIIECVDLPAKDANGFSDPYVKVYLLPDKKDVKTTKIMRRNLSPKFDEAVFIPCHAEHHREKTLALQVMDHDRFSRDDSIGEILLPMKNVKVENNPNYWKHLQKPAANKINRKLLFGQNPVGEILISLCYLPAANKVTVVVIRAKNIPQKDMLGTCDPYIKLATYQGNQKLEKRKTSVKSQSLAPVYNESFAFTVPAKEKMETEINIVLTLYDYDILSSNDEIGQAVVGPMAGEHGAKHWKEMLSNPESPSAQWHKFVPKL